MPGRNLAGGSARRRYQLPEPNDSSRLIWRRRMRFERLVGLHGALS
jgi:hypothetical protein